MGLSSSQARLLNLTARMHDIEYKAQNLEAQKLQMANESTQVYKEYEAALNKQKVQLKKIGSDGAASYEDATIKQLLNNGYQIQVYCDGKWWNYTWYNGNSMNATGEPSHWAEFSQEVTELTTYPVNADMAAGTCVQISSNKIAVAGNVGSGTAGQRYMLAEAVKKSDTAVPVKVYKCVTAAVDSNSADSLKKINIESPSTLRNLVEAGFIVFQKKLTDGTMQEVNIATDTSLQEVSDETELKKAEAKYEADMRKIDAKDKKFDTDLAAMETERNAIKTEMDTLKTVAKDNVDRTFKLFS